MYCDNIIEIVIYTNLAEDAGTQVRSPDSILYLHYMPIPPHRELQWDDKTPWSPIMNSLDMLSTQRYQSETKTQINSTICFKRIVTFMHEVMKEI